MVVLMGRCVYMCVYMYVFVGLTYVVQGRGEAAEGRVLVLGARGEGLPLPTFDCCAEVMDMG